MRAADRPPHDPFEGGSGARRAITLRDGERLDLLPMDYPFAQEWTWDRDPATRRVRRIEHGRPVFLYHELLKRHRHDTVWTVCTVAEIEALFSTSPAWGPLVTAWHARLTTAEAAGLTLPDPFDALAAGLTTALYLYYEWLATGKVWTVVLDAALPDGGDLVALPMTRPPALPEQYTALGDWMASEFTGCWIEDEDDPDGGAEAIEADASGIPGVEADEEDIAIVPELYTDRITLACYRVLATLLVECNPTRPLDAILTTFEDAGCSLDTLAERLHEVLQSYPVPEY